MNTRLLLLLGALLLLRGQPSPACCALGRQGQPVINADQTVLLIWDPATKTEHFIRKASFLAQGDDFGFIVPTPTRPELSESGNAVFPALAQITKPIAKSGGVTFFSGCTFGMERYASATASPVKVVERKEVAGFDAAVLAASTPEALTDWLKRNGYSFSPEVEAWAAPYIRDGWMLTALRIAKPPDPVAAALGVSAAALRISFHTEHPLFPYREPDSREGAKSLGAHNRLLRVYFISDARYRGAVGGEDSGWNAMPKWSSPLSADQKTNLLGLLALAPGATPATWWLTEFEHYWPYEVAAGDLYFSRDSNQATLFRTYTTAPIDLSLCLIVVLVGVGILRSLRRRQARAA